MSNYYNPPYLQNNMQQQPLLPQYNSQYNPNYQFDAQRMVSILNPQQPIPQQMQQQPQQQVMNQQICRPVTSIDEAKAAMIDAFNIYIFTDFANGKIYTKQITNNGTAALNIFNVDIPKAEEETNPNNEIISRLDRIESVLVTQINNTNINSDVGGNDNAKLITVDTNVKRTTKPDAVTTATGNK